MSINKISFIVPCFNASNTIEICIKSILSQLEYNNDEIIIINDGSNDQTNQIINQYRKHENFIIKEHKHNRGLASARNTGINNASGDILIFVDSDMKLNQCWLSKIKKIFENESIVGVMGQYTFPRKMVFNQLDHYLYSKSRGPQRKYNNGDKIHWKYFLFSNTAIKRTALTKVIGFNEAFTQYGGEDTELAIRLYEVYPNGLYYYSELISYHYGQKKLELHCLNQRNYGKINLHKLINMYPEHKKNLAGNWLTSWYGYLIFNDVLILVVDWVLKRTTINLFIKYKIAYNVIMGYRSSSNN